MVQRKVLDKLGIQADHLRHDHQKSLNMISLKRPSSSQHQDGKTRGPEVKKKVMKKSRSFKLSEIGQQSLKASSSSPSSSALRRNSMSQPGEPPPTLDVPSTSLKVLLTPKKQNPILPRSVESSPNYMKPTSCFEARRELRFSSSSKLVSSSSGSKKPAKTSGTKLAVRTLTKTPSFKHSRPSSAKKSSRVALCASRDRVDVQKATCSSTLKDSKFPPYLMLNHGGTESEGTSVMKVCPYTYCSLNGHHHKHASLPPLKRFLSAKRRTLKMQKSAKLAVPSDKDIRELADEEAAEKVGINFFIEIYAESEKKTDFVSSEVGDEETEPESCIEEEQIVESLSDGSPQSEIDAEESLEQCLEEIVLTEAQPEESFAEEEAAERDYVCPFSDGEETDGSISGGSSSDMEWEERQFSDGEIEEEADNWSEMDDESESILGCSSGIGNGTADVLEDNNLSSCNVDMNQEYEEDSACFGGEFAEQESGQVDGGLFIEQLSHNEDECKDVSGGEGEGTDTVHIIIDETSAEELVQEQIEAAEEICGGFETEDVISPTEAKDEDQTDQFCNASKETNEANEDEMNEEHNASEKTEEISEMDGHVNTVDLNWESCNVLEEAEEGNDAAKISEEADGSDDHGDVKLNASEMAQDNKGEIEIMEMENKRETKKRPSFLHVEQESADQELRNKWSKGKREIKDSDDESTRKFNPREPNYLPLAADPEGEKVDLKHQDIDERKNSEEWMIDHALQQAVTKLGPARKRRVALLIEAFETVSPITKFESHQVSPHHHHQHHRPPSPVFPNAIRPIQACN